MTNKLLINKLQTMLELQDKMNTIVNPDWKTANNDWTRAAWIECAELCNHIGWKWWKDQPTNLVQAHIELADIWHFLLSQAIVDGIDAAYLSLFFDEESIEEIGITEEDLLHPLKLIEDLVRCLLQANYGMDFYTQFYVVCVSVNLDFDELYRLYVGKNVLNIFRQDNGYKAGEYLKEWKSTPTDSPKEDNVYLEMFMEDALNDNPEDIYKYIYDKLEAQYALNF